MLLQLLINVNRNVALQRKSDGNRNVLADSHWEMLLKAVGQPFGIAKRVLESCCLWAILKGV
jgi:hypothetical protein